MPNPRALSVIASAYGELEDGVQANALLQNALSAANDIDDPNAKSSALGVIASAAGQLEDGVQANALLQNALSATNDIDNPDAKSEALGAIASAAGELEDGVQANALLQNALSAADDIDDPDAKFSALSTIASAAGQLEDVDIIKDLLMQIRPMAEKGGYSSLLSQIAFSQSLYGDWQAALRTLHTSLERDKVTAFAQMLMHHAESRYPALIDGPIVLAVKAVTKPDTTGRYEISVTIQSPDEDCDYHADWWEILRRRRQTARSQTNRKSS